MAKDIPPQKGDRTFMIEVEDTKKVIGKIEKDFELMTKAHNLCPTRERI